MANFNNIEVCGKNIYAYIYIIGKYIRKMMKSLTFKILASEVRNSKFTTKSRKKMVVTFSVFFLTC